MRTLVLHFPARHGVNSTAHLTATTIASLIDRTLDPVARARAELHLSSCAQCREELASSAKLISTAPGPTSRRRSWGWIGLAAAVVIAAISIRSRAVHDDGQAVQ